MTNNEFKSERMQGIGGSDVAVVLGISPWKTPYQLYLEKTNKETKEYPETEAQHFGKILEDVVAQEFANRNHVDLSSNLHMVRHSEHPELIGHIDRWIVGGGILECKTSNAFKASDWGESGSTEIPNYYYAQVQHYMYITGEKVAWVAVLIGGNDYRQYKIEYNEEYATSNAQKCVEFWNNYILKEVEPPAVLQDDLNAYYKNSKGASTVASSEIMEQVTELRKLKVALKAGEDRYEELAGNVKIFMGEAGADTLVDDNGTKLVTWKPNKDKEIETTNWKALVEACGISSERVAEYTTKTIKAGARPFSVK